MSNNCESIAINSKFRSSQRYSRQDIHMVDGDAFAIKGNKDHKRSPGIAFGSVTRCHV